VEVFRVNGRINKTQISFARIGRISFSDIGNGLLEQVLTCNKNVRFNAQTFPRVPAGARAKQL
jgi:hypothetical protein